MTIDQVHIAGMRPFKAEDDAPVAGDADRPITRETALQPMQPKARQVHVGGPRRLIQAGQDAFDPGGEAAPHPEPRASPSTGPAVRSG